MNTDPMTYDEMYDYALEFSGNEDFANKVADDHIKATFNSDAEQRYIKYRLLQESLINRGG